MTEGVSAILFFREAVSGENRRKAAEKAAHEPAGLNKSCRLPR